MLSLAGMYQTDLPISSPVSGSDWEVFPCSILLSSVPPPQLYRNGSISFRSEASGDTIPLYARSPIVQGTFGDLFIPPQGSFVAQTDTRFDIQLPDTPSSPKESRAISANPS